MVSKLGQKLKRSRQLLLREIKDPLRLSRLYRSQVLIGQTLIALGVFMSLNVPKPSLWLLEDWGGLSVPPYFWGVVFCSTGLLLVRGYRVAVALTASCLAFVELVTVAAAAFLSQGASALVVLASVMALHAAWTATDLHLKLKTSNEGEQQ